MFSMRRADREVRRSSPPDAGPLETGVVLDIQPARKPGRAELLRVRSLRTQQRAESQCQVIPRVPAVLWMVGAGIPLVDGYRECQLAVLSRRLNSSTESLILAQDERWRRA